MAECEHCKKEIRLEEGENKCPSCKKPIRYICWNCQEEINPKLTTECIECGYYFCPRCDNCGPECSGEAKFLELCKSKNILFDTQTKEELNSALYSMAKHFFLLCEKLQNQEGRYCPRGVPKTHAYTLFPRLMGHLMKQKETPTKKKWQERIDEMVIALKEAEENAEYEGQEWIWYKNITELGREGYEELLVLNYLICIGQAECKREGRSIKFRLADNGKCNFINKERGEKKKCRKCGNKYGLDIDYCPNCKYGKKIIKHRKLYKIKDRYVCEAKISEFKKYGKKEKEEDRYKQMDEGCKTITRSDK